jgi:hypothetical protein
MAFSTKEGDENMNAAVHRVEGYANAPVLYMAPEPGNTTWKGLKKPGQTTVSEPKQR